MPKATVYNKIQGSQQLNYLWTTSSGVAFTDSIVVNTAQQITVTTTNQYGCTKEKTVNIMADFTSPDIQIIGNGIIECNDSTTILQAFLTNPDYDYFWLGPDSIRITAPEIELNRTGRYTLNATDTSNGCTTQIYQDVTKQNGPTSLDVILDPPLCFGELGYFTIQNIIGGTSPFSLLLNDMVKTFDTPINIPTGSYTWQIADANGCKIGDSFTFDDVLPITLDAGRDTTIQLFDSYPIEINTNVSNEDIASITWTPFQSLSCMDCPDPVASPLTETRYVVSLIDKNGCEISDDITIKVAFIKGFVAPNIFNPQSNFGNNRFTVYSKERSIENINLLSIFDRWGNLVFTKKDFPADTPSFGWDGSISGQIVQNGVYVWVAEIRYIDQTVEIIKGDVTIIR